MRLWHKDLIPYLPRQQLLGQWRECCLIAKQIVENGTPNHVLVNRVMEYPIEHFDKYVQLIYLETQTREYRNRLDTYEKNRGDFKISRLGASDIYKDWHNDRYLRQCLYNLQEKADCGAIPAEEWKQITDRWPEWR